MLGLVLAAALLSGCGGTTKPRARGGNWPAYLNGNDRSGFARLETALTPATVPKLAPKWTVKGISTISDQATVVGDRVYWGSWDGFEHATDTQTGKELWRTYLGQETKRNCVPRGSS